jgi:hypothetical protein
MKNEEAKQFPEQELIFLSKEFGIFRKNFASSNSFERMIFLSKEQESFERILLLQILSKECKQNLSL